MTGLARAFPRTAASLRRVGQGPLLERAIVVLLSPLLVVLALLVALGFALLGCDPDDGEHGGDAPPT